MTTKRMKIPVPLAALDRAGLNLPAASDAELQGLTDLEWSNLPSRGHAK
jgi:hypothetical protein